MNLKKLNQAGVVHVFLLLAIVGVISFLAISTYAPLKDKFLSSIFPKDASQAATPVQTATNKISWQGNTWNVTGVNMPWFNWGCDFGCNNNGGVVGTKDQIAPRFQQLKDSKMHMVRWWVFPGDNPWQITVDSSGMPTGINSAVYADFDAALQLAEQYDLYYNFVLFNSATAPRRSWIDNPTHRTALAQVLGTLFARYKDNPRVMSWEIYNEPEFQIWDGLVSEANVVATAKAITDSVHANSDALVTVGNASVEGIPMWTQIGLDYYSPHWYDYMSWPGACMRCTDYNEIKNRYGLTKPIVVGEMFIGNNNSDDLARFNDFYDKGYAGIWGWSLFHDHTADLLQVNLSAATQFVNSKTDIGPKTLTVSPSPSLSPTPSPSASPAKRGDLNNDGRVNVLDLSVMLSNWGRTGTNIADLNNDQRVNVLDLSIMLSNWG